MMHPRKRPPQSSNLPSHGPTLTRRHILLGGLGSAVALPFLESLAWAARRPASSRAPWPRRRAQDRRFMAYFTPNGHRMDAFRVEGNAGPLGALSRVLTPLEPMRAKINVLQGITMRRGELPGIHSSGCVSALTASDRGTKTPFRAGNASVDQVAATASSASVPISSLLLSTERSDGGGTCEIGYSCTAIETLSWAGPDAPVTKM